MSQAAGGWIMGVARKDRISLLSALCILFAITSGLLWWNGSYIYNAALGPFDLTPELASNPGRRVWIRSSGTLVPTGLEEQTTVKLLKGLASTTSVSAKYLAQPKDGKLLIVKLSPHSSGDPVLGELLPLPATVVAELASVIPRDRLQPFLLDASRDYYSFWAPYNVFVLFVVVVALVLLISVLGMLLRINPRFHPELQTFARSGSLTSTVSRIEADLARFSKDGEAPPFRHSPTWLVWDEPSLGIVHRDDLVAFAPSATGAANAKANVEIQVFRRAKPLPSKVPIEPNQLAKCLGSLVARFPWALQEDAKALGDRWVSDQKGCEAEALARRKQRGLEI